MDVFLKILSVVWDVIKVIIFPVCLILLERQISKRDDKREQEYAERKRKLDEQAKHTGEIQFLMMQRLDKVSEMTHLMAMKLHDQGVINGDLAKLDEKYQELDAKYEEEVRRLALIYSQKQ